MRGDLYISAIFVAGLYAVCSNMSLFQRTMGLFSGADRKMQNQEHQQQRRLSYSISRDQSYNLTFMLNYRCPLGRDQCGSKVIWRKPLSPGLQPLLNMTTSVRSNLRILFMGDSVAIQLGQLLEESLGTYPDSRILVHESWAFNEGVTFSKNAGGGAVALYRTTGMLLASGEGEPLPNAAGGGWNRTHVHEVMQHLQEASDTSHHQQPTTNFDVMIFRISHGWLRFDEITKETIMESLDMAQSLFGVQKFILIDIPFTNNIKTNQDLDDRLRANRLIRQVADSYNTRGARVTVLHFAKWTDQLLEFNARAIGMLSHSEYVQNKSFTLDRLGCSKPKNALSIAQGCAALAQPEQCNCHRNRISEDGMHWCLESIGGRCMAGVACLLTCLEQDDNSNTASLRQCEQTCNSQYMSMRPLNIQEGGLVLS